MTPAPAVKSASPYHRIGRCSRAPGGPDWRIAAALAQSDAAAEGSVQNLRHLLDPLGGGVQSRGDCFLCHLAALDVSGPPVDHLGDVGLELADPLARVEQLIGKRE